MKDSRGYSIAGKVMWYMSILFMILFALRHVNMGVDLWDGGYNYANFRYNSLEYMDSMWFFATWLANSIGHLLTLLPFADTMLGMNFYCALSVGAIGAGAYVFCVKKMQVPAWLAAIGEFIALSLCWAPVSILYNYLTYGLLLVGIICLYQGLVNNSRRYLVFAGVILGLNVGNRFSNLVQAGLILAVWYYGFICKKKLKEILQETGLCILGYVVSLGIFLSLMTFCYGLENYIEGILQLFEMTEYATDYSAGSMLTGMIGAYLDSTYWLKRFGVILAAALIVCILFRKKRRPAQIMTTVLMATGTIWLVDMKYLYRDYATYNSIYDPCVMVFIMAMLLAVYQMCNRKYTEEERLQAAFVPLLILLTSLGGNNAVYSSINNLFFVFPCFLGMLWRFCKREQHVLTIPFKGILVVGIGLLLWQTFFFGKTYVYEEATGGRAMDTEIVEIPVLAGMYTGAEKAEKLEGLYQYLQENELQGRECILFGDIPGISYYMELTPAMNIWSDLRSYGTDRMKADLAGLDLSDQENRPVIILEKKAVDYLLNGDKEKRWETTAALKLDHLGELMEANHYNQFFYNEKYAVYY